MSKQQAGYFMEDGADGHVLETETPNINQVLEDTPVSSKHNVCCTYTYGYM